MITVRNYTNEEIQYIKDNFMSMTTKQIAENLKKKESSIYNVVRKLGLIKQQHNKWAEDEIKFLKENYIDLTSEEISNHINHSVDAINTMRDRLNLIRSKSWSDKEIEFLKNNFESMLFCDLSKILERTEGAIRAKCFDLNLFKKSPWTEDEIAFVKENYMEMKTADISKMLNRTMNSIELKASRLGLKKYPYTCDYHYFDKIDTEEKAYWLGFLTADGWINRSKKTNSGVTGIELQYGDIEHLRKFNKSINGNYQITDRWKRCAISTKDPNKKYHVCIIRIFSITMYETLCKLGFSNNKSYDFCMPELQKDLIRHYIRGYFDGDGGLCFTNKSFHVDFTTASQALKDDIIETLKSQNFNILEVNYINDFDTMMYRINMRYKQDKINFLDWIYKDCSICLDRKYKKYLKVKKHYDDTQSLAI